MRRLVPLLLILTMASTPAHAQSRTRGLLWRVVQTCVLNHRITGAAFPCTAVETSNGTESGYAVLRAPSDDTHVIVTPTVRTIGIEAERLRGAKAPNYFHDAWAARHFVTEDLSTALNRDDIALAVNSRLGRSQDQLHIHIACVRADVKQVLARDAPAIRANDWTRIRALPRAPHYWVHFEKSADLAGINVIDKVATGLDIDPDEMDDVTIVVIGSEPDGFMILARKRVPHSLDKPHGEALLDPNCARFRKS